MATRKGNGWPTPGSSPAKAKKGGTKTGKAHKSGGTKKAAKKGGTKKAAKKR